MAHQAGLPRSGKGYDAIHKGRWAVSHSKKEVDIQGHVGHPSNNVVSAVQRRHPGYNINTHSREAEKTALRKIDRTGD